MPSNSINSYQINVKTCHLPNRYGIAAWFGEREITIFEYMLVMKQLCLTFIIASLIFCSCTRREKQSEEQLIVNPAAGEEPVPDSLMNSVAGNVTMKQVPSFPNNVILTGLNAHRLVSVYRSRRPVTTDNNILRKFSYKVETAGDESVEHFMPGLDVLFGYNLLNIAHYDLKAEKVNFLFSHPVLVKTLYYPSLIQDSLEKQPINRNYYLVTVYDEDTNKDTVLNKKDLRHLYHFDSSGVVKTQLIPADYSVIRSQYDPRNDVMYVFAKHDENKNGAQDATEPVHIFWFSLKKPGKAKLLY